MEFRRCSCLVVSLISLLVVALWCTNLPLGSEVLPSGLSEKHYGRRDPLLEALVVDGHHCPFGLYEYQGIGTALHASRESMLLADLPRSPSEDVRRDAARCRIPRNIVAIVDRDPVPMGMFSALSSMIEANPGFNFTVLTMHMAEAFASSFFSRYHYVTLTALKLVRQRIQFFSWCYLLYFGGIVVDASVVAAGVKSDLYAVDSLSKLIPCRAALVLLVETQKTVSRSGCENNGTFCGGNPNPWADDAIVSPAIVAAVKGHPLLREAVDEIGEPIDLARLAPFGWLAVAARRESFDHITGGARLTTVFRKLLHAAPKQANSTWKAFLASKTITTFGERSGKALKWTTLIPVFSSSRRSDCLMKAIGPSKDDILYWSRYPRYGDDMQWWRHQTPPDSMDIITAWETGKLFDEEKCGRVKTHLQIRPKVLGENFTLVDWPAHRPARSTPEFNQRIPRIIMQTNKRDLVPPGMHRAMRSILERNPAYVHYYFSDRRARDFVSTHFPGRVMAAFDALIPGAFKSDLFRLCWLVKMGGIYIDADMEAGPRTLDDLIQPTDEFVSADDCGNGDVYNAFMASIPNHPFVVAALEAAVDKISRRDYGTSALSITGPTMVREVLARAVGVPSGSEGLYLNNTFRLVYHDCDMCGGRVVASKARSGSDSNAALLTPYYTYRSEMLRYVGMNKANYYVMYDDRRVFVDGN